MQDKQPSHMFHVSISIKMNKENIWFHFYASPNGRSLLFSVLFYIYWAPNIACKDKRIWGTQDNCLTYNYSSQFL